MSEDVRKHVRTQGKYSDTNFHSYDRGNKIRDKKQKVILGAKEPLENKVYNRNSNGNKSTYNSLVDENISPVKYEEDSNYSFRQLEEVKKPIEIVVPGKHILSTTDNGESIILYEPDFLTEMEGCEYYEDLYANTNWHTKNIVIHGVEYPQPRLVAWYGPFPYSYSGATLEPAEMPSKVIEIKQRVEEYLRKKDVHATFNSVLMNLYRDGKDSVSWHSDDETTMGISPTIASVSLGETRRFEMRRKVKYQEEEEPSEQMDEFLVYLSHGSLIIMTGCMQDDWQHRVPKEYHDRGPRINLTFRTVYPLERVPERFPEKETKKKVIANSLTKTHNSELIFDAENFPPLSTDMSSVTGPNIQQCNMYKKNEDPSSFCVKQDDDSLLSENWDVEDSSSEQNDFHGEFTNDYPSESMYSNNEPYIIDNNRSLNAVESHIKVSIDSPTSITPENNLDFKKTKKNRNKDSSLKFRSSEAISAVNDNQDNNLNEEVPRRWHGIVPIANNFTKKDSFKKE